MIKKSLRRKIFIYVFFYELYDFLMFSPRHKSYPEPERRKKCKKKLQFDHFAVMSLKFIKEITSHFRIEILILQIAHYFFHHSDVKVSLEKSFSDVVFIKLKDH
jgi:hypothetical protein